MKYSKIQIVFFTSLVSIFNLDAQHESIFGDSTTAWSNSALLCDAVFTDSYFHKKNTAVLNLEYKVIFGFGLLRESI